MQIIFWDLGLLLPFSIFPPKLHKVHRYVMRATRWQGLSLPLNKYKKASNSTSFPLPIAHPSLLEHRNRKTYLTTFSENMLITGKRSDLWELRGGKLPTAVFLREKNASQEVKVKFPSWSPGESGADTTWVQSSRWGDPPSSLECIPTFLTPPCVVSKST